MNIPIDVQKTYDLISSNLSDGDDYIKKYYDEKADGYDYFIFETLYILGKRMAENAHGFIGPGPGLKCIDFGCGTGEVGINLRRLGSQMQIDGFDISTKMLKKSEVKSQKTLIYDNLIEGNIKKIDSSLGGNYDVAISAGLFTKLHAGVSELDSVISVLKSGGVAFISVKRECFTDEKYSERIEELVLNETIKGVELSSTRMWNVDSYSELADIVRFEKV
jgi:predicted TPR repeat methyltransferase